MPEGSPWNEDDPDRPEEIDAKEDGENEEDDE